MYIMAKKFFEEFVSKYNIKEGNVTNTYQVDIQLLNAPYIYIVLHFYKLCKNFFK